MSDNIKVVVKVRPLISREIEEKLPLQWRVSSNTLYQIDSTGRDSGQSFTFDKVYDETSKTSEVYDDVAKPIVEAATAGFNGTIFAYGQTSSGKTYTMAGTKESPGIIQLAILNLFDIIAKIPDRDFLVRVSYIEIYNETLKDLLDIKRDNIKIHELLDGNIKVDVSEKVTASPEEVIEAMKLGDVNRQTGSTNMNEKSSRSHSIFQITIESREHVEGEEQAGCVNVAQLNLVDLAGSERPEQTGATGQRFKEGTYINKSLFSLTLVIKQLSEGTRHANYRDSKLTRILQNSLGGNAKTSIICAVTPAALEETISTLKFATRAKTIKNKPEVNAVTTDATMIQDLTKELSKLQAELHNKKNLEVMLENKKQIELDLQKRIQHLQRLIIHGFTSRAPVEAVGKRAPRRVTISALHSYSHDVTPAAPRFCTPALKYNPMAIPTPSDFAPIQSHSSRRLASLPEEPRTISPSQDKKNNYSGEIIELDSDDDASECASIPTCSPYHKCRDTTKTPPCILRKNKIEAERNLNDIMKLTEREKIYTPNVVELMEKLEHCTNEKAKLSDEIELLKTSSKEKDEEMNNLKSIIISTENEVKQLNNVKSELESQCKKLTTKVTEWEVIYETLHKKAKAREVELLSLLEEQKHRHAEDISKVPYKQRDKEIINFMDMSKDISLVNSDNESSTLNTDEDQSSQIQELVTELQSQLADKNKIILNLEAELKKHKERIDDLEKSNQDVEKLVAKSKEEIKYLENENTLLRTSVETLNSTIKSQKESLDKSHNDLESCYSVIKELQIKLTNNLLNKDQDTLLETLIDSEEKTIANNDNIKNIIHSLKLAIENRNKELNELKETIRISDENSKKTADDLKEKTSEIEKLQEELFKSNALLEENIVVIDKLMQEKTNLVELEQELTNKLSEIVSKNSELEKINKDSIELIDSLNKSYEQIKAEYAEKIQKEINDVKLIEDLQNTINVLNAKIDDLEQIIKNKDELLIDLDKNHEDSDKNIEKAKNAINKIQNLFLILSGDVQEIPDMIDNLISVFNVLSDSLNALEEIALITVAEKDTAVKDVNELKNKIYVQTNKHAEELQTLKNDISNLNNTIEVNEKEKRKVIDEKIQLENDILRIQSDYATLKNEHETNLSDMKITDDKYNLDIANKERIIKELTEKLDKVESELDKTSQHAKDLDLQLQEAEKSNEFKKDLAEKVYHLMDILDIESGPVEDTKSYDNIFILMDKIISKIQQKLNNINEDADKQVQYLTNQNSELSEMLVEIENENQALRTELAKYQEDSITINENLYNSKDLLQQLKEELHFKSMELTEMEEKTKEWKDQFESLDVFMKQQVQDLQQKNEILNKKMLEIQTNTAIQVDILKDSDLKDADKIKKSIEKASHIEMESPPSLLTICCNTILDYIDTDESKSTTGSSNIETQEHIECKKCKVLSKELDDSKQNNAKLLGAIEKLETLNNDLLVEQDNLKVEIHQLIEPAQELQKKILNHKTNLSILTATTYAENKSLQSQLKGLQHHHVRFHNVCQRDLPEFKKQLHELMTLLKGDPSFANSVNLTVKRYSLPNVLNNESTSKVINESTLDGDMLMLDTNITLTTADNTLVGNDQTCLDITQTFTELCDSNFIRTENNALQNQMDVLRNDNQNMFQTLDSLQNENLKLKILLEKYPKIDANCSPIKLGDDVCKNCDKNRNADIKLEDLSQKITILETEKEELEMKYNNLVLETPSNDALVSKINQLEQQYNIKVNELAKVKTALDNKMKEMRILQEENDSLSSQVMDNISEADDLNKVLEKLKQENEILLEKCKVLESHTEIKNGDTVSPKDSPKSHSKLNRSLSDSDTSSRMNKISTLQSELHAGKEDCKVLTEDVASIKQHLDCSNMSVDLDDNDVFSLAQEYASPKVKKHLPDIKEEIHIDYKEDKMKCYNYYLEKIGADQVTSDMKIIDILELLYNNLVTKHSRDVDNLNNKLKEYEESEIKLKSQIADMTIEFGKLTETLADKDRKLGLLTEIREKLKQCLKATSELTNIEEAIEYLKINFFTVLDANFKLSSVEIFDTVFNKCLTTLDETKKHCTTLQNEIDVLSVQVKKADENIVELKKQLQDKENECSTLLEQKTAIHEITNAVTLDIVKKEQELNEKIMESYKKLQELDLVSNEDINLNEPSSTNINLLVHNVISTHNLRNKEDSKQEIEILKKSLEEKEFKLNELLKDNEKLKDINNNTVLELNERDSKLEALKLTHENLNKEYENKIKENIKNLNEIDRLTEDIQNLKEIISKKDETITKLLEKDTETELLNTIKNLQQNIEHLKSVNDVIMKEKESCLSELAKSCETIKQNNNEMQKMTSDILVLRESLKEATEIIDKLKSDTCKLSQENGELKINLEDKTRACSRLETNIKTHEKAAEVQSRIIIRLQKLKEEDEISINDKQSKIKELTDKHTALLQEHDDMKTSLNALKEELERLRTAKENLEQCVSELQSESGRKSRSSLDAIADSSRRRRRSLHDSKRLFEQLEDDKNMEAVFESRQKHDDLFMDVDFDTSGRSTPYLQTKGRDSNISKKDQSDNDEDPPSRPSSVLAIRRRRQSIHDMHRSGVRNTPSPHDVSKVIAETENANADTGNTSSSAATIPTLTKPDESAGQRRLIQNKLKCVYDHKNIEIKNLKEQLSKCQQELEDLKERYKDLDEECETCAQYLREREEQCIRLKREKQAIEQQLSELKKCSIKTDTQVADVSVNTDEDWANLHSVVVDRMSYDAEVEKNKKLTKTIEELRFKKQDLKNTMAKMQKALEKSSSKDCSRELEATKEQLRKCKAELEELRVRCKELDEECETCAEYLKEKDETCRKLKEAKAVLETKLKELQEESHALAHSQSVRKKRQTIHDMNRQSVIDQSDATTETSEDLLSYQVERDNSRLSEDAKQLKMTVEKLTKQKASLEHQLRAMQMANPMYVATGSAIIQNQQITDVMKENQRLKKINSKLVNICKKRGKSDANRENADPCDQNAN